MLSYPLHSAQLSVSDCWNHWTGINYKGFIFFELTLKSSLGCLMLTKVELRTLERLLSKRERTGGNHRGKPWGRTFHLRLRLRRDKSPLAVSSQMNRFIIWAVKVSMLSRLTRWAVRIFSACFTSSGSFRFSSLEKIPLRLPTI